MTDISVRPARATDRAAIMALADRLAAFGPSTRSAAEIAVFADNSRAKELYRRQGWRVELETHFKTL